MSELSSFDNPRNQAGILRIVKSRLTQGDSLPVRALLQTIKTTASLNCIREQKLLFKIADLNAQRELLDLFKERSCAVCDERGERRQNENYADFVLVASRARCRVAGRVSSLLQKFPRMSFLDFLRVVSSVLSSAYEQIRKRGWTSSEDKIRQAESYSIKAAESARTLHDIKGACNNVMNAAARAVNEVTRTVTFHSAGAGLAVRTAAEECFLELISEIAVWDGIEYFVDQVTYGGS
jgi:hypothetical protein